MTKKNQSDKPLSFEAQAAQAIKEEAEKIANATQVPGQSKNETRLITQGIAKGIEIYKKQEKAKARERSRAHKKKKTSVDDMPVENALKQPKTAPGGLAKLIKYVSNFMVVLACVHFAIIFVPKQTIEANVQWLPIIAISVGIFYLLASMMFGKIANSLRKRVNQETNEE